MTYYAQQLTAGMRGHVLTGVITVVGVIYQKNNGLQRDWTVYFI